jgi:hypothetical protein
MRTSKVDRYQKKLVELRGLRYSGGSPDKEKAVLEVMDVLWEAMTMEERQYFSDTNHLSWPPPTKDKEEA